VTDSVETPAEGPGSALKSAREALSVSEREVADALNLPLNVVEAMEANDYDKLPSAVFTRGYLRSYARLLELDAEAIIAKFPESAQPEGTLTAEMAAVEPIQQWLRNQPVWLRAAAIGVLSLLVILMVVWLWSDADEAQNIVPVSTEAVRAAADDSVADGDESERGTMQFTEATLQPVVPGQTEAMEGPREEISPRTQSPDDGSTLPDQNQALSVSDSTPVSEVSRNEPSVRAGEDAAEDVASAPTSSGMRRISPFGDDVLSLSFAQDCWVDVKDRDGNRLYGDLNRGGTSIQLIGRAPFRVLLGYAPGTQMSFNGDVVEVTRYTRNNVASLTVGG